MHRADQGGCAKLEVDHTARLALRIAIMTLGKSEIISEHVSADRARFY